MTITLSDICMPRDKAREWKEAGGEQIDVIHKWVLTGRGEWELWDRTAQSDYETGSEKDWLAAPTVGEAMIWMSAVDPHAATLKAVFWSDGWRMLNKGKVDELWDRLIWLQREGRL